jgi:hypothetical protein
MTINTLHNSSDSLSRKTFVSLRVLGIRLNPSSISNILSLSPSESFTAGSPRGRRGVWPHGYWEFNSSNHVLSENFEEHLQWMLDRIGHLSEKLSLLKQEGNTVDLYCYWQVTSMQNGISISSDMLKHLANLGLPLELDIYGAS